MQDKLKWNAIGMVKKTKILKNYIEQEQKDIPIDYKKNRRTFEIFNRTKPSYRTDGKDRKDTHSQTGTLVLHNISNPRDGNIYFSTPEHSKYF